VTQTSDTPLFAGTVIDTASLDRFQRACANCHSEQIQWPWYGRVAPASWLLENDVLQARSRLNASRWTDYSMQERITLLSAIGAAVRSHAMPPARYRLLHPDSDLPDSDRSALYEWTKTERRRLRALAKPN
jgi:cytochrome c